VLAPTFGDARDTCIEGPSGLIDALERRGLEVAAWNRSIGELRMASGAAVRIDGADDGVLRPQGHNFRRALCDELGLWRPRRRGAGTTTPKPTPLMRRLPTDSGALIHRMTTFENEANLAPVFLHEMQQRYDGTRLGRQDCARWIGSSRGPCPINQMRYALG
jgi:phage terminase large subunit-like protein